MRRINLKYKIHAHTIEEYNSIRAEMIERIQILNNQSISSISACIAARVITATLFLASFTKDFFSLEINNAVLCIMLLISSLLPTIFLFPAAIKSGENLAQITAISCFIRVFFEHSNTDMLLSWESANNSLSNVNVHRKKDKLHYFYNTEYVVLSILSLIINVAVVCSMLYREENLELKKSVGILSGIVWIMAGILTIGIYIFSSVHINMEKHAQRCIYGFVLYGIKNGDIDITDSSISIEEEVKMIAQDILCEGNNYYQILYGILEKEKDRRPKLWKRSKKTYL